ncbi:MAG: LLM class flavin-dependent oxidoreductase [Caldilineaceae bacterium]|nr:LLM class flavin-dependent oxidoreductase [Caldilineaceae bacterium]
MPALARSPLRRQASTAYVGRQTSHNPFLPLTHWPPNTRRVSLGTAIAVAFARSPTALAHLAWDLQRHSQGRFLLGAGHAGQERTSCCALACAGKTRCCASCGRQSGRAVWARLSAGRTSTQLRGEFYTLRLMTPFFAEPPLDHPDPPVYISAVNEQMLSLAEQPVRRRAHSPVPFAEISARVRMAASA